MHRGKSIVALIPARGGSKGLPGKNIKLLLGKPLIAWSIEHGLSSAYVDRLIISTDDHEIAETAKRYGAEVPFLRPARLATDEASSIDVIEHALEFLKTEGCSYDYLLLLEPTSPLREVSDIDTCVEKLAGSDHAKAMVSVARLESGYPEYNVLIDAQTGLIRKHSGGADFRILRRQEMEDIYFLEGTVYLSEIPTLLSRRTFYHDATLAHVVPRWKSVEIDELQDLICAGALLRARLEGLL